MIVIRRRFPNFICDGRPLANDEEYYNRFEHPEEFYELEWVKEKEEQFNIVGWFLSGFVYDDVVGIYAVYDDDQLLCHAILEEGLLDMPIISADVSVDDGGVSKVIEYFRNKK